MSTTRWRKSTRSSVNGNCVELAHTFTQVRDSKNGHTLTADVTTLLAAARTGTLDR